MVKAGGADGDPVGHVGHALDAALERWRGERNARALRRQLLAVLAELEGSE